MNLGPGPCWAESRLLHLLTLVSPFSFGFYLGEEKVREKAGAQQQSEVALSMTQGWGHQYTVSKGQIQVTYHLFLCSQTLAARRGHSATQQVLQPWRGSWEEDLL